MGQHKLPKGAVGKSVPAAEQLHSAKHIGEFFGETRQQRRARERTESKPLEAITVRPAPRSRRASRS